MSLLVNSGDCCNPNSCADVDVQNIPGPAGAAGAAGDDGTDGINAFTTLAAQFVQPAVNANVLASFTQRDWIVPGQEIFIEGGGYYLAVSEGGGSGEFTIKNRGYDANVPPTTVVPAGAQAGPAGEKGEPGEVDTNGALLAANNLSDVNNTATARTNLGLTSTATTALTDLLTKAGNLSGLANTATSRANLGVTIGTNVQAYSAILLALAGVAGAANKLAYFTGASAMSVTDLTAFARTLLDDTTAEAARSTLGVLLPRYGVLSKLTAVDMNTVGDTVVAPEATKYRIDKIMVTNASLNLTTATVGVFGSPAGAGTVFAADQVLTALTAAAKFRDLTLDAGLGTDTFTAASIYFRVGTAQGAASTADVYFLGWSL